jgi:hypothetical protein
LNCVNADVRCWGRGDGGQPIGNDEGHAVGASFDVPSHRPQFWFAPDPQLCGNEGEVL